jgi:hypothetical protein
LDSLVTEVEPEVQKALSGLLTGAIVRNYLPQAWVFETEDETVTFYVDTNGKARTLEGAVEEPDVGIRGSYEDLHIVLTERRLPGGAGQRILRKHYTGKGKAAWAFLKDRFGF